MKKLKINLIFAFIIMLSVLLFITNFTSNQKPITTYASPNSFTESDFTDNDRLLNPDSSLSVRTIKDFTSNQKLITTYTSPNSFTESDFTDNDRLLNPDGSLSVRTIKDFASDMKQASTSTDCSEITKVIPSSLLYNLPNNSTHQFNGKEYGYYLVKDFDSSTDNYYFDLLLIDFSFENISNTCEYKMRIEPILQKSFKLDTKNGLYKWSIYSPSIDSSTLPRYKYYIANTSFLNIVMNENSLNYNDNGYNKEFDNGVIIQQARFNFGEVKYKTETDLIATTTKFVLKKMIDSKVGLLYNVIDKSGKFKTLVKFSETLYDNKTEITVEHNNENNIYTSQSRTSQKENESILGYSRLSVIEPKKDLILSDDSNSYAEVIILLNDSNYKTHLYQFCNFEISKRLTDWSSMQYISDENGDHQTYSVSNDQVLFDEQEPNFTILNSNIENSNTQLYILPNGKQTVNFQPQYSGKYIFDCERASLSIPQSQSVSKVNGKYLVTLSKGVCYKIILHNSEKSLITGYLTCKITDLDNSSITINGNDSVILGLTAESGDIKKIISSDSNLQISIISSSFTPLKTNNSNFCYYNFSNNVRYFIVVTNPNNNSANTKILVQEPQTFEAENEYKNINIQGEFYFYVTTSNVDYILQASYEGNVRYQFCSNTNAVFSNLYDNEKKSELIFLHSQLESKLCFGFSGIGTITFQLVQTETAYKWEVNGKTYSDYSTIKTLPKLINNNYLAIQRGSTTTIKLKVGDFYISQIAKSTVYTEYSFYNNTLQVSSNCQLTNDENSNMLGLVASLENHQLAQLHIYVIYEKSEINLATYNNNDGYGLSYNVLSNSSSDEQVSFIMEFNDSYTYTIANDISFTKIDLYNYIENQLPYISENFSVKIKKIILHTSGGHTTIYNIDSTNSSHDIYIEEIPIKTFNRFFLTGNGTSSSPYIISCNRHLINMREYASNQSKPSYTYKLYRNLTITNWNPIPDFKGTFDLNGKIITFTSKEISNTESYGFILVNNGTIKSGVFKPNFTTKEDNPSASASSVVGVVCAQNKGTISNITIEKTVTNPSLPSNIKDQSTIDIYLNGRNFEFGAIAGINCDNAVVEYCYNYASIGGKAFDFSGIIGRNGKAKILSCRNYGKLIIEARGTSSASVGGIVSIAADGGVVNNCGNYSNIFFAIKVNTPTTRFSAYIGQIAGRMCKSVSISSYTCNGSVTINPGITIEDNYITDGAVGYYFDAPSSGGDSGSCVAAGTLITLSDGRQIPVENLTGNESLLVWNMITGKFDSSPILFIDNDPFGSYTIINLNFSDNTTVKVISEHAFWDCSLNKYIYLRSDAAQYIGHYFNKQSVDDNGEFIWTTVQLTNVTITEEYTTAWSPVTYGYLCYYVNGMLSAPGATEGFVNIFDVSPETMTYDELKMSNDINQYGLYTYEEFSEIFNVSQNIFTAFKGQYLKVSIGKGLIDVEKINHLIERYSVLLNA